MLWDFLWKPFLFTDYINDPSTGWIRNNSWEFMNGEWNKWIEMWSDFNTWIWINQYAPPKRWHSLKKNSVHLNSNVFYYFFVIVKMMSLYVHLKMNKSSSFTPNLFHRLLFTTLFLEYWPVFIFPQYVLRDGWAPGYH